MTKMKKVQKIRKIMAGILCFILLFGLTAFADTKTSKRVEETLIKVKQKVDVPDFFTQFESSEYSKENQKNEYSFRWNNDDYSINMNINSDADGHISYYYYYDRNIFNSQYLKRLSKVKKDDAFLVADAFIKKIAPECFEDENDRLIYVKKTSLGEASQRGTYYNFTYKRMKNGVFVRDNVAEVRVFAGSENNIIVSSVNISYDYSASFEEEKAEIENLKAEYSELFPVEMIYERDNYYYRTDSEKKTNLIYRIKDNKIGYMSAYLGEEITPDPEDYFRGMSGGGIFNQAMKEEMSADSMLSPVEIKEIEKIDGLKSFDEIKKTVEKIPYLDFSASLQKNSESLTKQNGHNIYNASFRVVDEEKERNLRYSADAEDGKIISVYNNIYDYKKPYSDEKKETLSVDKWKEIDKKVFEITDYLAKEEIKSCEDALKEYYGGVAHYTYTRKVNGVKYPSNSIGVSFNVDENSLQSFNLNFTDDIFSDPKNAIDAKTAFDKILEIAPLTKIYVKSDGVYKLCYGLDYSGNVKIDAFSGESMEKNFTQTKKEYQDLENHWSKEAVEALADVGIGYLEESFNPDKEVTQLDLLRLFASGIYHNSYMNCTEDEIYELMINDGIISKEEKNPTATVKREDAFCYLVRLSGLEKVAKLSNIFKTDFSDNEEITPSKIGHAAILAGFGVVEGNGGSLKPKDFLTRAEAVSLLYKYMRVY